MVFEGLAMEELGLGETDLDSLTIFTRSNACSFLLLYSTYFYNVGL